MHGADTEAGYATAAAALISLSLAIVASAVVAQAGSTYRLAKSDLDRSTADAELDAAFVEAEAQVLRSGGAGPFLLTPASGQVRVRAELESQKLKPGAAAALNDQALHELNVADAEGLRRRLAALDGASPDDAFRIEALDGASSWRRCALSYVSLFGQENHLSSLVAKAPTQGLSGGLAGEVWRLVGRTTGGAGEERYVRFQGDVHRPVAVLQRRRTPKTMEEGSCPDLVAPKA